MHKVMHISFINKEIFLWQENQSLNQTLHVKYF